MLYQIFTYSNFNNMNEIKKNISPIKEKNQGKNLELP